MGWETIVSGAGILFSIFDRKWGAQCPTQRAAAACITTWNAEPRFWSNRNQPALFTSRHLNGEVHRFAFQMINWYRTWQICDLSRPYPCQAASFLTRLGSVEMASFCWLHSGGSLGNKWLRVFKVARRRRRVFDENFIDSLDYYFWYLVRLGWTSHPSCSSTPRAELFRSQSSAVRSLITSFIFAFHCSFWRERIIFEAACND